MRPQPLLSEYPNAHLIRFVFHIFTSASPFQSTAEQHVANARLLDHICIPKVMISLSTILHSSKQVKAGDVIVKVGQVYIQNQAIENLRDLILGDPGSFVVLGFQRGSQVILLLKYFCYCLELYITIHSCRHEHPVFYYRPLLTLLK